jgi:hypothetical protein
MPHIDEACAADTNNGSEIGLNASLTESIIAQPLGSIVREPAIALHPKECDTAPFGGFPEAANPQFAALSILESVRRVRIRRQF